MPPRTSGTSFPLEFGTSGLVSTNFDAMELSIGPHLHDGDAFFRSALPTWFNLLNLGMRVTATADSDSHRGAANPVGLPRNFIACSVDPRDGMGADHDAIDLEEYAVNIREGRVTVSAGPVVMMYAESSSGVRKGIGETYNGSKAKITVEVGAPSWAWFDTIEIYTNTDPIPVDDDTDVPMQGVAADPEEFYKPYHIPRYTYSPTMTFKLSEGTLESWAEEDGAITAKVTFDIEVSDDTWIVALARGTRKTEGYRSLFPIITNVLKESGNAPDTFDPADLTEFHSDKKIGASAWGMTNPIYMDVDGDGFEAKFVHEAGLPHSH
ncbi:MAG: hypothetical protein HN337_06375 [Deltaproteobacteria bacterium]|nr:hypothetical protein [Deltaproteobacteria bacterium]